MRTLSESMRIAVAAAIFAAGPGPHNAMPQAQALSPQAEPSQAPPAENVSHAPRKLSGKSPVYPPKARRDHVSGTVRLRAMIAEDGTVEAITVLDGPEPLRQASIDAVSTWIYSPGMVKGKIVEMEVVVSVSFHVGPG